METIIQRVLDQFETGKLSRRQLTATLVALTTMATAKAQGAKPKRHATPFKALSVNHVALRVTDVERSRDFYVKLLGVKPVNENLPHNCFLSMGSNFVALFRGDTAGMDHYCYAIDDYDVKKAEKILRAQGFKPEVHDNRIYFKDPDGLKVQLSETSHGP